VDTTDLKYLNWNITTTARGVILNMIKTIIVIGFIILLVSGMIFSPRNTFTFIKNVSVKIIDLFATIYKDGKPIVQDIQDKINKTDVKEEM